jgi:tRNA A58 N-methylase Trm61
VTQPDKYLLGRGEAEEARLKRQIADLAPDSDAQFEKIGIKPGERVVDFGCGPGGVLHLLGKRVGPTGSVVGVERSPHFVDQARRFITNHGLPQVEVREGDVYDTRLARASFDGGHMRLVLINVPKPGSASPASSGRPHEAKRREFGFVAGRSALSRGSRP